MIRNTLALALAFSLGAATAGSPGGRIVSAATAPVRVAPSGKARIHILADGQGGTQHAFLGILEMDGGGKVPEHRDKSEEYIYILQGGGQMTIDGVTTTVKAGDAIFMPSDALVSFAGGPEPLKALQVFAPAESAAKYEGWTPQ